MLGRLRFLIQYFWLLIFAAPGVHATAIVVIVSSERSAAYLEASQALAGELERTGLSTREVLQITAADLPGAASLSPRLFVALGTEAAKVLAKTEFRTPVLCTLLPRFSFERVLQQSGRKSSTQFSALYLDQPVRRQLDLIRLALPKTRRIGVLWGPESQGKAAALETLSQVHGMALQAAIVEPDKLLFFSLKRVLEDADLLLAIADPQVYNDSSIQNILLASFRARVPMVAFSPAYVRAGALLALYVSPTQIGRQAAAIAASVLQGKTLSATPLYSRDFLVAVNEHVARSLGLSLDAENLRTRLRRLEEGP